MKKSKNAIVWRFLKFYDIFFIKSIWWHCLLSAIVLSAVPLPPHHKLTVEDVFGENMKPNIELLKEHFMLEGRLEEEVNNINDFLTNIA